MCTFSAGRTVMSGAEADRTQHYDMFLQHAARVKRYAKAQLRAQPGAGGVVHSSCCWRAPSDGPSALRRSSLRRA